MSSDSLGSINVLHVDDEPEFAETAASFIEREDDRFDIEVTTGPHEAFDRLDGERFDCIVSDYDMPRQSGIEFLEAVRKHDPDIPFILFTGKGSEEIASEAMSAGVTDYLQKEIGTSQYTVLANRIENSVRAYRAEQQAEQRRRRLEQILKTVPDCVVQLDTEGRFVFANERAEEVLGLDRDEVTDRAYNDPEWDIRDMDGDPIPDEQLPFRRVRDTGEPVHGVRHTIQWPDGSQKVLLANGSPLLDDDGNVDSIVFSLTDITEQQDRERELQSVRRRLELAMEATDTGVYEWDMQTDEVIWSESLERVMGLEPGEFESTFDAFVDRIHPDDLPRVQDQIEQAIETESMYQAEFRMRTAEGDYQWVKVRGRVIRDEDGERMIGVHQDITERKGQEMTLDRQRSLLKAQQEAMIDGLLVVDEDGEMISYNDQFVELWEIPEELAEQGDEETALEWAVDQLASPEEFRKKVEDLYENPEETSRDEINLADGRVFDRYTAPVVGDDGTYYGRLWAFRNITREKEREAELEQQNDRLEEFVRVVSHDLRNPLNVAQARLDLAMRECESDHLNSVDDALTRSQTLIDDLLQLAREGNEASDIGAINLGTLANSCWHNVATGEATITVETDRTIQADRSRLQQLLENLFRNAIDHGGDDVTVTVGGLSNGFYIEDNGPGIPADERDDVFDAGYSTAEDGTGFGLRIVQQIAEAHGWEVKISEGKTGGARFEIISGRSHSTDE